MSRLDTLGANLHLLMGQVGLELRREFSDRNLSSMNFTIEIEGRPDGELKLSYGLGRYVTDVKGNNLAAVVAEFMRRHGWQERHDPVALPPPDKLAELVENRTLPAGVQVEDDDQVPF